MRISSKIGSVLGSCLIIASAGAAAETPSSRSEQRGYQHCVRAVEGELQRDLSVERTYYTNTHPASREFYMNAKTRQNGEWQPLRIACETTRSGYRILAVRHEEGRYLGRTTASLAQN